MKRAMNLLNNNHKFLIMIKKIGFFSLFILCISAALKTNAQPIQNLPNMKFSSFYISQFTQNPPLSTGMPLDVLYSYIALDSACKAGNYNSYYEFINRQTMNDTIRTMMKYLYKVIDYDALTFARYNYRPINTELNSRDIILEFHECNAISGNSFLDNAITFTDYILKVQVLDTLRYIDSTNDIFKRGLKSNVKVMEVIKGNLPPCYNCIETNNKIPDNGKEFNPKLLNNLDSTFCLDILLDTPRGSWNGPDDLIYIGSDGYPWTGIRPKLVDSLDKPWIVKDLEYIVFLRLVPIEHIGNTHIEFGIMPMCEESLSYCMYPIINGSVHDAGNDMGGGQIVPLATFLSLLNNKINIIKNY